MYRTVFLLLAFVLLFTACAPRTRPGGPLPLLVAEWTDEIEGDALIQPVPAETPSRAAPVSLGDEIPISRAMTAKMLALAFRDMAAIDGMPAVIAFTDVSAEQWHYKYINAVYTLGFMAGTGATFDPDAALTLGQAHRLLTALEPGNRLGIAAPTENNRDKPVSYALWVELYGKLLEIISEDKTIFGAFGLEAANIIVLSASNNTPGLPDGQFYADTDVFTGAGFDMSPYIDKEIRVLHKNREVVALAALISERPVLKNVFITDMDSNGLTIFTGGARRYYTFGEGMERPDSIPHPIADLVIRSGTVTALNPAVSSITGTLLKSASASAEFREWGVLPLDTRFKVYSAKDGDVQWQHPRDIIVGADMADFYIKDGVLCAAVIMREVKPERIRVLIGASDYGGLLHPGVTVTANTGFTVRAGAEEKLFNPGQRFTVSDIENSDLFGQPRIYISCGDPNGRLQLVGLRRNWPDDAAPQYRGIIEIALEDNGYAVVNELSLEEYLYAVVPSEMPGSYGLEAAKAQAVTARSYAYNNFYENRFRAYGAHVDDSVTCQVYNNIPENNVSIEAVDATKGQCLVYQERVISASFFSTSGGYTANSGEVWAVNGRFPAPTPEYLQGRPQYAGESYGDLSVEENAARFYKDKQVPAYDSHVSWFRWQVRMTAEELAASVNAGLPDRRTASPDWVQADRDTIGDLKDITVVRRGTAGNIMEIRIDGTAASVRVLTEYNIRLLLAPKRHVSGGRDIHLYRKDGTYVSNYALMPSAFFVMDKEWDGDGKLAAVTFYGGGNGHGAGMSQNGAKGMIDRGYGFAEVLAFFYPGTEVMEMTGR